MGLTFYFFKPEQSIASHLGGKNHHSMSSTPTPIEIASDSTTSRPGSAVGSIRDQIMGSDDAGGIDDGDVGLAPTDPPNQEERNDEKVVAPSASPQPRRSPSGSPLPDVSMRRSAVLTEDRQQEECPPSTPTPSGRVDIDEFEYSRWKQSPTSSQRGGAELAITDAVQNFQQLPKSERRRALLQLKKELDNQRLLSGLGIEEDVRFDGASTTSSDDSSIYSNDSSTAFYTEASTAFYSTAIYTEGVRANHTFDTSDYSSGDGCGRNATQYYRNTGQGRSDRWRSSSKGFGSNNSVIYDEEDYDKQACSLTDACVSLFMGDYKVEVNDISTNQRARGDATKHRKEKGSGGSKVGRRSKSKEIFEDDSSDISLILGSYKKKDNDGNERSDQCAQTNGMSWHTEEEQMGEEVLVDYICGGSEVSRKSTRGSTVEERPKSHRGGKKSDEKVSYGTDINHAAAQAVRSLDYCGGVSLISGDCKVEDDVEKKHKVEEEMRVEVSVDDISCRKSKTREINVDEISSDQSLTVGDYKAEADEENKQSNHLAQSNETSRHKEIDEMGEDILVDDVICGDSKVTPKSKSLFKRSFKKSDERASVTLSPTRALEGGIKGSGTDVKHRFHGFDPFARLSYATHFFRGRLFGSCGRDAELLKQSDRR